MLYKVTAWEVTEDGKLVDPIGRVNNVDLWDAKAFIQDILEHEVHKLRGGNRIEFKVSNAQ